MYPSYFFQIRGGPMDVILECSSLLPFVFVLFVIYFSLWSMVYGLDSGVKSNGDPFTFAFSNIPRIDTCIDSERETQCGRPRSLWVC